MIILLTACINPRGMSHTFLNDVEKRKMQYIAAINYYISQTHFPIVFAENSGIEIKECFQKQIKEGRLECLSFWGNQDKLRGKGYGECEIIQYALENSKIIHNSSDKRIIKITGRLIVKNISKITMVNNLLFSKRTTFCSINSNLSFPDSRLIVASSLFYYELLNLKETIDDSKSFYFEHALCKILKEKKEYPFSPFIIKPIILGISGSTGEEYTEEPHSLINSIRYLKYTVSQYITFKRRYR